MSIPLWLRIAVLDVLLMLGMPAQAGSYEDFFQAVRVDQVSKVDELLARGFDPNTPSPEGFHALMLAIRSESFKVAERLADTPKVKIEVRNEQDESPLMLACIAGQLKLVEILIAKGADVNKPGWTPLHYAASKGHVAVIQYLLDQHAYIDAESPNQTTPLMMAALYGSPESVALLLNEGADPLLKNEQGLTALDFAKRGDRVDATKLIGAAIAKLPTTSQPKAP